MKPLRARVCHPRFHLPVQIRSLRNLQHLRSPSSRQYLLRNQPLMRISVILVSLTNSTKNPSHQSPKPRGAVFVRLLYSRHYQHQRRPGRPTRRNEWLLIFVGHTMLCLHRADCYDIHISGSLTIALSSLHINIFAVPSISLLPSLSLRINVFTFLHPSLRCQVSSIVVLIPGSGITHF
ncbi:hypothetical protein BDR07DRAFT_1339177 [Suillus spraguei]|nr:hypothetical protein BDR07DRAFT_1339177 [Suillus spraguei]